MTAHCSITIRNWQRDFPRDSRSSHHYPRNCPARSRAISIESVQKIPCSRFSRAQGGFEMHYFTFVLFLLTFTWFMVTTNSPRRLVTVTVAGILVSTLLLAPPAAEAEGSLLQAIQAVLNLINGMLKNALNAINTARAAINDLYQNLIWPVELINQARAQVTQMINEYRTLMSGILAINLSSATLPNPQSLETLMRDHQVNNFSSLSQLFGNTYGAIPTSVAASQADRDMSDMDDAL